MIKKWYNMEDIDMNNEYEVISEFSCYGKPMVTVKIRIVVHVMELEEWHKVYGRNHQEKWGTKVDWKSFTPEDGYKIKVS